MKILFPNSYLNKNQVNESFESEYNIAKTCGLDVYIFDDEKLSEHKFDTNLLDNSSKPVIRIMLRSWMLSIERYLYLVSHLRKMGYELINSLSKYIEFHYSIHALKHIKDYTPNFYISNEKNYPSAEFLRHQLSMTKFNNNVFILKDYVKSVKNKDGEPLCIDIRDTDEKIESTLYKFRFNYREDSFAGHYVFKEKVKLKKYDGKTNEWRVFILDKCQMDLSLNTNAVQNNVSKNNLCKFVSLITTKLNTYSNFFTFDCAELEDGTWTVLETGDGQVSGPATKTNLISLYNNIKIIADNE